jgi:glycogen synthase
VDIDYDDLQLSLRAAKKHERFSSAGNMIADGHNYLFCFTSLLAEIQHSSAIRLRAHTHVYNCGANIVIWTMTFDVIGPSIFHSIPRCSVTCQRACSTRPYLKQ